VINRGELTLVENKIKLMHKLGRKQLTLQLTHKLDTIPPALAAHGLTDGDDSNWSTPTTPGERTGITDWTTSTVRDRVQGPQHRAEFAGRYLRRPGETMKMNVRAVRAILDRDGAHLAHAGAEHRIAGHFDLALFRRVRRRNRVAHFRDRGGYGPSSCRA
jgi:hypothetical protein